MLYSYKYSISQHLCSIESLDLFVYFCNKLDVQVGVDFAKRIQYAAARDRFFRTFNPVYGSGSNVDVAVAVAVAVAVVVNANHKAN